MTATKTDYQVASLAAGFSLGFGFLTAWEAIKQTRRNKSPLRSSYIYMIWGEIAVNIVIAILGWLFLDGILKPTVPVLFFILFCWVWEIQLLMQIIINRIAVIAESQKTVRRVKYGTVVTITAINVAVFCIWIPSHMNPPVNDTFVLINKYWDPVSKVLILLVDAGLNWYFLRIVQERLLNQHGLVKYTPLVSFNTKLLLLSILMDGMLIGLMFLPNPIVFIQFHPVTYLTKLNIEMSLASLIARLAQNGNNDVHFNSLSYTGGTHWPQGRANQHSAPADHEVALKSFTQSRAHAERQDGDSDDSDAAAGIQKRFDVEVTVSPSSSRHPHAATGYKGTEDEMSLAHNAGYPLDRSSVKGIPAEWHPDA